MNFRDLPDRPDHPRYEKRLRDIEHLKKQRKERLVEEGMWLDRFTAEDCFWWFCWRFTPFATYRIDEKGHDLDGELWIKHPFLFWLCRQLQEQYVEPPDGWVWMKIHRKSFKTTLLLDSFLWLLARDPTDTIALWTHKVDEIGSGMGRGLLAQLQTDELRDHWPQFRNLREGTKQGFTVDRPPGPRDQSLAILSIETSTVSLHPRRFALDDVENDQTRDNPGRILKISENISKIALMQHPGSTFTVANTPWDESGPLMTREREGGFAKVIMQTATAGGNFTPPGEPNLHTKAFFDKVRKDTKNDSLFFPQMNFEFRKGRQTLFDRSWLVEYTQRPEEIAAASPYVHILIDGAKGTSKSDFAVIRVLTWISHESWATLDLIRERIGVSAIMQMLLGRDKRDPATAWIEEFYRWKQPLVEKWMGIDRDLTIWFDDQGNQDWKSIFTDRLSLLRINFSGKTPNLRVWPQVHRSRENTKVSLIQDMESHYQAGHAAYPKNGFGHGSYHGLVGQDGRDTYSQFLEDEYDRMKLGHLPPNDDMLDSEAQLGLPKTQALMRRPAKGSGYQLGGVEYPAASVSNPWGIPGGGNMVGHDPWEGRSWVSM